MNLDNVPVSAKLRGVTIAIVVAIAASGSWMQIKSEANAAAAMGRMEIAQANVVKATRWRGLIETNIQRTLATSVTADPVIGQTFGPALKRGIADSAAAQNELQALAQQPDDKAAFDLISAARSRLVELTRQLSKLVQDGDTAGSSRLALETMKPAFDVYLHAIDDFVALQATHCTDAKAEAQAVSRSTEIGGSALMLLVSLLALAVMTRVSRSISRPLAESVGVAQAIAQGDLTQQIRTGRKDEIGSLMTAMAAMNERLRALVGEVRNGVQSVSIASSEIASGSLDLSTRTEHAASSLQEASSSMEQLTGTVSHTADTAKNARQLATSAIDAANRGGAAFAQVTDNMSRITESSRLIADITATIDGIAFQTNILALNAAVEAARAGEQGRGFAVVAGEVRALAQRSAAAAREIKTLIGGSVETIAAGSELVERAGGVMSEVVASVRRVGDLIGDIATATSEQHSGISDINQAVNRLDQMTQQNAALVEESAAAAGSLKDQATRLAEVVGTFQIGAAQAE
jgi:methyl-accepting chemotaxis protein